MPYTYKIWEFEDWLVEFDGDISLDMVGLRPLVDKYSAKSLVLLKWYWRDCQPWDCFMWECEDMLQNRTLSWSTSALNFVLLRDTDCGVGLTHCGKQVLSFKRPLCTTCEVFLAAKEGICRNIIPSCREVERADAKAP